MQSNITKRSLVFCLGLGIIFGWLLNSQFGAAAEGTFLSDSSDRTSEIDMGLFWDVYDVIGNEFYGIDEVIDQDQVYGATKGLVKSLGDPYSVFMDPEETEAFSASLNGELEGIGAELTVRDGILVIVSPLKNSPAEEAGVLPGDHIYLVDGEPTSEMTIWDAIMNIRGEPGTEVVLTLIREDNEGNSIELEVPITRAKIEVPSVEYELVESNGKKIAHVNIYQFGDDTYNEFSDVIREAILEEADGMILDLRLNGGGYLDVSIELLSEFFEDKVKGVIVKRRNNENDIMYTDGGGRLADLPLVVLIDEGSASASEIVAGAIQDYERGVLMGETSFGKGSVQELSSLLDGSTLRLTIAKWFTPNDRTIDGVGIDPDVYIEMETEDIGTENDLQYLQALDYLSTL